MQRKGSKGSEKDRETREGTRRKVEVRAPHEPRAGPALRVVLRYALRRPHPFCTHPPSPTPSSTSSSSSSSSRRRSLLSSTGINLGRLHLYLMLPISRLIPSAYSLPPLSLSFSPALLFTLFISRETHHPAGSSTRYDTPHLAGSPGQPRPRPGRIYRSFGNG